MSRLHCFKCGEPIPVGQGHCFDCMQVEKVEKENEQLRFEILKKESSKVEEKMFHDLQDNLDLNVDEFDRIKGMLSLFSPADSDLIGEIAGICDRALKVTKQKVPLIEQRDKVQAERDELKSLCEKMREGLESLIAAHKISVDQHLCTWLIEGVNELLKKLPPK